MKRTASTRDSALPRRNSDGSAGAETTAVGHGTDGTRSRLRPASRSKTLAAGWGSTLGGCALALLSGLGCKAAGEKPGLTFLPDMLKSVPYDTYDPNPVTGNGQTLRLPAEGTVAMGASGFAYGPGPEEARRAGAELENPLPASEDHLARGRQVYEAICIVCHGPKGEGDGPIIGRFPNPPNLLAERARSLPDGQIYHIISRGQAIMPSHAAQVLPPDRWRLVLYLRQLQDQATAAAGGPR